MFIELQEPFKSKWEKAYIYINNENRRVIQLTDINGNTFGTTYSRYLMGVKLGYEVPDCFEVDHINNDKTDDRIENLQLLTPEQNRLKQEWWYAVMIQQWHIFPCDYCQGLFYITQSELNNKIAQNVEHLFCSRSCSAKYHNTIQNNSISKELSSVDIELIKQLRSNGLSSYKIAGETGFARNTVMKYW